MTITAKMVSELRGMTGAAMMDCKKALEATGGDLQAAVDQLRKQGLKSAAKKAERETAEGRVFAVLGPDERRGHMVGLACETDFLAGSDKFKAFVAELETHVAQHDPDGVEAGERPLLSQMWESAGTVAEALQVAVGQFGENLRITELARLENAEGKVGVYIHHDNKQGAIASVSTSSDGATGVLRSLCQHIVVFEPTYANREDVPGEVVEREKAVIAESDEVASKPEAVRDKIVQGKLGKFYAGCVLSEQPWILDDKTTVGKTLASEFGPGARIEAFSCVKLGA